MWALRILEMKSSVIFFNENCLLLFTGKKIILLLLITSARINCVFIYLFFFLIFAPTEKSGARVCNVYNYHVTHLPLLCAKISVCTYNVFSKCSQGPRRLSTYIIITKAQTTARLSFSSRTQKSRRLFFAAAANVFIIKRAARNITMEHG